MQAQTDQQQQRVCRRARVRVRPCLHAPTNRLPTGVRPVPHGIISVSADVMAHTLPPAGPMALPSPPAGPMALPSPPAGPMAHTLPPAGPMAHTWSLGILMMCVQDVELMIDSKAAAQAVAPSRAANEASDGHVKLVLDPMPGDIAIVRVCVRAGRAYGVHCGVCCGVGMVGAHAFSCLCKCVLVVVCVCARA